MAPRPPGGSPSSLPEERSKSQRTAKTSNPTAPGSEGSGLSLLLLILLGVGHIESYSPISGGASPDATGYFLSIVWSMYAPLAVLGVLGHMYRARQYRTCSWKRPGGHRRGSTANHPTVVERTTESLPDRCFRVVQIISWSSLSPPCLLRATSPLCNGSYCHSLCTCPGTSIAFM